MSRRRLPIAIAAAALVAGCGGGDDSSSELPSLPAQGSTPGGDAYTLDVARQERGPSCLSLETRGRGGASSTEERCPSPGDKAQPHPDVVIQLVCKSGDLFLYGVAAPTDLIRLVRPGEPTVEAERFKPPEDGAGAPFVIITRAARAGRVEAVADGRVQWRRPLPARADLCTDGEGSDNAVGTL